MIEYDEIKHSNVCCSFSQSFKDKKRMRRSHNAMEVPGMVKCPNCGEMIKAHRVCPKCGNYKGKNVVQVEEAE